MPPISDGWFAAGGLLVAGSAIGTIWATQRIEFGMILVLVVGLSMAVVGFASRR